jgi:hypothetical protein
MFSGSGRQSRLSLVRVRFLRAFKGTATVQTIEQKLLENVAKQAMSTSEQREARTTPIHVQAAERAGLVRIDSATWSA